MNAKRIDNIAEIDISTACLEDIENRGGTGRYYTVEFAGKNTFESFKNGSLGVGQ